MDQNLDNVIIVGSGPAAYTACMYTRQYNPLMLRGDMVGNIGPGGQLTTTTAVDNFPGFAEGIQGLDLMNNMKAQMDNFNIRQIDQTVTSIEKQKNIFIVKTNEATYKSLCVIVSTGASARRLYVEGTHNDELWQKGISSCAVCDGFLFMDMVCAVIGGGDSAMEEVLFLSKICKKVYLIHRRTQFRSRKDKLVEVQNTPNIEILVPYNLKSAHGDDSLKYVILCNEKEEIRLDIDGLFFGIGHDPNSEFLNTNCKIVLDFDKYIVVDNNMQTKIPGLFACGDVIDKIYRQAVTAAETGCVAGINASSYIEGRNK